MCDLWKALLVGFVTSFLGLAIYIVVQRRRRRLNRSALVLYSGRALARVETETPQPDPFETEDQKAMREYLKKQARYIHHPPLDTGGDTMPLEYQKQMVIIVRLQRMYRDGTLFFYRVPYNRWPRR